MPDRDDKNKADQDPIPRDLIPEESSRPILGLVYTTSGQYWCGEADDGETKRGRETRDKDPHGAERGEARSVPEWRAVRSLHEPPV